MTTLEIIFLCILFVETLAFVYMINWYKSFNDDLQHNWMESIERSKKLASKGVYDSIFDVERFNVWFNSEKDKDIYAHPGIFLRLDKLSQHHIHDYIRMTLNGAATHEDFPEINIINFEDKIRENWMEKMSAERKARCEHEFVSVEYAGQTYGNCESCGCTVLRDDDGNWSRV